MTRVGRARRFEIAAVAALGMALPAPARASEGDAPEHPESALAESTFREAVTAYAAGRYHTAIDLFGSADRLRPRPELSFDIARSYEKLGNDSAALGFYREYLRRAGHPDDEGDVERRVELLESHLAERGVQQARFLSIPTGAAVFVDGEELGITPMTSDLRPGAHRLTLRLAGYADLVRRFDLPARTAVDVTSTLVPWTPAPAVTADVTQPVRVAAPRPDRPDSDQKSRPSNTLQTLGWVSLGVAAAAVGGAVVFEIMRSDAETTAEHEPEQIQFARDLHTMERDRTAARVFAGAGAAFGLTGAALLIFGRTTSPERPSVSFDVSPASFASSVSVRF